MDTEHRVIAKLMALKAAPDDMLLDQVQARCDCDSLHAVRRGRPAAAYRPENGDGMPHPDRPHRRADPAGVICIQ
jgi:hypothetical protein